MFIDKTTLIGNHWRSSVVLSIQGYPINVRFWSLKYVIFKYFLLNLKFYRSHEKKVQNGNIMFKCHIDLFSAVRK